MIRRLPLIPTIIVALAAATMIGLGVWQLQRAQWKERLLAQYSQAERLPPIAWPSVPPKDDALPLYRHATGVCLRTIGGRAVAGAITLELAAEPPFWVHLVWIPVAAALTIGGLRLAKAWLLGQEYRHQASEGKIAK